MKRLVRIGGGSSGYTLLRALKQHPFEITAVVNMFDSGGSTGVLRDEFGVLPPGDIRRALAALADGEHSEILRDLFNYRFKEGGSVSGHSFGNLFLTALASIYGSDLEGIRKASELLHVKGTVVPVSVDSSHIHAILADGTEIVGETNIDIPKHDGSVRIDRVFLEPAARLLPEAAASIRDADIIVMGPGDLYTSVIPNLLVDGMKEALASTKGKTIIVCNLMTKWGETHGFSASDMVRELLRYSGLPRFDVAIVNTGVMSPQLLETYARGNQFPMRVDDALTNLVGSVVARDLVSDGDIARHDGEKLATIIASL